MFYQFVSVFNITNTALSFRRNKNNKLKINYFKKSGAMSQNVKKKSPTYDIYPTYQKENLN